MKHYSTYHQYVIDHFEGSILELGSGINTGLFVPHFNRITSIEESSKFMHIVEGVSYVYAPIHKGWYHIEILKDVLPGLNYNLVIVDGPRGSRRRKEIMYHFDLFNLEVPWIFDDTNRSTERSIVRLFCKITGRNPLVIDCGEKEFTVV